MDDKATKMTPGARMSTDEVLAMLGRAAGYILCTAGIDHDDYHRMHDATDAVAAMIEREAVLIAERDALEAKLAISEDMGKRAMDGIAFTKKFIEAMANDMRAAGCEVDTEPLKVRNTRADQAEAERDAYRNVLREFQDARRIRNPHTRQVARDIEQQAIARADAGNAKGSSP